MRKLLACAAIIMIWASAHTLELSMFEDAPGVHWYSVEAKLNTVFRQVTYDCVTPETAMKLTFLEANEPDCVYTDSVVSLTKLKMSGVVFWVKGDGSNNMGVAGITPLEADKNSDLKTITKSGCTVEFPLKDKFWKRCAFKFSDFKLGEATLTGDRVKQLYFSVKPGSKTPVSYIIDKVGFTKNLKETEEDLELGKQANSRTDIKPDPKPVVPSEFVENRPALEGFRKKLASGQEVTIVAFGDSLTAGTAVWRAKAPHPERYVFHYALKNLLADAYKNDKITVVNAGIGGEQASHGFARLDRDVLSKKPDLVIYEFGNNDGDIKEYTSNTEKICDKLDAAKIAVIIMSSTVFAGSDDKRDVYIKWQKDFAKKRGYGYTGLRDVFLARGDAFIGDYLSDDVHPSYIGHRLFAEMVYELLRP